MPSQAKFAPQRGARSAKARRSERSRSRTKLSTTVAAENFAFLETMVGSGRSGSIAEAVDLAIYSLRRAHNRARLESATAEYFDSLSSEARKEERDLANRLHATSEGLDFDLEP